MEALFRGILNKLIRKTGEALLFGKEVLAVGQKQPG